MMKKILLIIFLSLIIPEAHADYLIPKDTLHDLPKFFVLIDMKPELETKIARTTIRTDVEIRLRKAGILIFSHTEAPFSVPWLYVLYTQTGGAFSIELSLNQEVYLVSHPTSITHAATWEASVTGIASSTAFIRQAIKDLTDVFINDYLSVNPHSH